MPEHDTATIVIRPAYPDDAAGLARLAALDSTRPLRGPVLLAESDGQLRAALATAGGAVIADPFFPTADLVALLQLRARGTSAVASDDRRRRPRWRLRSA